MDSKKIIGLLIMCVFLINIASALEFDNVKSYDITKREVTITNAFGLGGEIAKVKLNTPIDNRVGLGYQKVAEFEINSYGDYIEAIKELELYDIKDKMKGIVRDVDYKYKSTERVNVNDYAIECNPTTYKNGTKGEVCERVVVGNHSEDREVWLDFSKDMKAETLTVGIFTDVQEGDYVEWIPNMFGVRVSEWATWTADLNTNLVAYYRLNTTGTNTMVDLINGYDGTCVNCDSDEVQVSAGKIGNGLGLDKNTDDTERLTISDNADLDSIGSICLWTKISSYDIGFDALFVKSDTWNYGVIVANNEQARGFMIADTGYALGQSSGQIGLGDWYHVCLTVDGTNGTLYVNGNQNVSMTLDTANMFDNTDDLHIGGTSGETRTIDGAIDEVGIWSRTLTSDEITQLYNEGNGMTVILGFDTSPNATLISPENTTNYTTSPIVVNFTCYGNDDINLTSMEFYLNGSLSQTNSSGLNDTNYSFSETLSDGNYNWSCKANDNNSQSTSSDTWFFNIDGTSPIITNAFNLTDIVAFSLPTNSSWHFNATDTNLEQCYYNTSDDATVQVITCNSTQQTEWATEGTKTIQFCANDTLGLETCNTTTINVGAVSYTQFSNPPLVATEGSNVVFNLTVNKTGIGVTTANLTVNNTIYKPTTIQAGANGYYFQVTLQVPDNWGNATGLNQSWYWNYTIAGVVSDSNTTTKNITVYELAIDDCSTYGDLIFNFTLKDEELNTPINATAGSNVEVDLTLTSKANSSILLTYNNTWTDDNNPQICIPNNVLNNSQYWIDMVVGYQATDKVWEFMYVDSGTLNSTKIYETFISGSPLTQNINLMDLKTTDSTSFLFNYFDLDGRPVDNSIVHVMRKYIGEGLFREVERGKADENADTIIHLVEEDVIYYFYVTDENSLLYTSSTYTALCQATPCSIQLEASGESADFPDVYNNVDGGSFIVTSDANTREVTMNYTISDGGTFNLTIYKYNSDGSYSPINSSLGTETSGQIILKVPQSAGNVSFFSSTVKDDKFIKSTWINFESSPQSYFGVTMSLFLGALIIMCLALLGVTEGAGTIIMVILGLFLAGALGLISTTIGAGISIIIFLALAGGIIVWKLTRGRNN